MKAAYSRQGFTLIELSIVLVIIGLIVGGILVARDMIASAEERSLISQIEKYNTAVNSFQAKYGGLPGDLRDPAATSFGFIQRGTERGEGDGNGIIEGTSEANNTGACGPIAQGVMEAMGETIGFWEDLSAAGLIEGSFTGKANDGVTSPEIWFINILTATPDPSKQYLGLSEYFPTAKIGKGNYIYVWSGGVSGTDGTNYFGVSAVQSDICFSLTSNPGLTVAQAYNIDQKMDDGLPQSGFVQAVYLNAAINYNNAVWAGASDQSATVGSTATCYDNKGTAGAVQNYSMEISGGSNISCALSFQFQ